MSIQIQERLYAPFKKLTGFTRQTLGRPLGWDNNYTQRGLTSTGAELDLIGTYANDKMSLGGAYHRGVLIPVVHSILTTAKISTMPLFVNNSTDYYEIAAITEDHSVANGAALTAYVSKEPATSGAVGSGPSVMSGTFNLNATANTRQTATLAGGRGHAALTVKPGEQLSLKLSTSLTSLAGLTIIVWLRPLTHASGGFAVFSRAANGDIADATMYLNAIAGRKIRSIAMRWGTAGSDAGTVTAQVEKDVSTGAPAGGTNVMAAAQSVKGTANYTVFPALAASAATYTLAQSDRLSVDMVGTLTDLANFIIVVFFEPLGEGLVEIPFETWDDPDGEKRVFVANDFYQLVGAYFTYSTASGGAHTLTLEKDIGTGAPAGGTAILNATVDLNTTTNTPLVGIPLASNPFTTMLAPGDGISLEHSTTGSLAGFFGVILLRKV